MACSIKASLPAEAADRLAGQIARIIVAKGIGKSSHT
jgi:hypothetical protein